MAEPGNSLALKAKGCGGRGSPEPCGGAVGALRELQQRPGLSGLGPETPSPPGGRGEVWKRICFAAKAPLRASALRRGRGTPAPPSLPSLHTRGSPPSEKEKKPHKTVDLQGPGFPCQERPHQTGVGGWALQLLILQEAPPHQTCSWPGPWRSPPMQMQVEGWSARHFICSPEGWGPCNFFLPPQSLLCAGGSGC